VQLAHAAKDKHEGRALPWALLTMLLEASCPAETKATEVRNAQFKAQKLASSDPDTATSTLRVAPFLELELLLLDMHLGSLALKTHTFAQQQPNCEGFKLQMSLCKAQATALIGDAATAVNMLKIAVRATGTIARLHCASLVPVQNSKIFRTVRPIIPRQPGKHYDILGLVCCMLMGGYLLNPEL
jgi:hypothetical protein